MTDLEKARTQRDAKRLVAGRQRSGSTVPQEAILRHLGLEVYKESHRTEPTPDKPDPEDTEKPPAE